MSLEALTFDCHRGIDSDVGRKHFTSATTLLLGDFNDMTDITARPRMHLIISPES